MKMAGPNGPLLGADATTPGVRRVLGVPLLVSVAVTPGTIWEISKEFVTATSEWCRPISASVDARAVDCSIPSTSPASVVRIGTDESHGTEPELGGPSGAGQVTPGT